MKTKILHLSDLHFSDNLTQDVVLTSMLKKIEDLCRNESKPDLIIITGDIAFSGSLKQYEKAKSFIDRLASICAVKNNGIFLVPGNHDVDRNKIKPEYKTWWYSFTTEEQVNQNLRSDDSYPKIAAATEAYSEFIKQFMTGKTVLGRYGEFVIPVPFGSNQTIKIVGLNSALFCGYDGDDQKKLALGLDQMETCLSQINESTDIIITCIHHPFSCFHNCQRAIIQTITRFSDIILSGHLHEPGNLASRQSNSNDTVFVSAGSSYETREKENSFDVIELDSDTLEGSISFFKYLPGEHLWLQNKDMNHATGGVFNFKLPSKQIRKEDNQTVPVKTNMYLATVDAKFDELNREKFNSLETLLRDVCCDFNIHIQKIENGSIKIFFGTNKDLETTIDPAALLLKGIKISKIPDENAPNDDQTSIFHWKVAMRPEFKEKLNYPGASFSHSRVDDLTLNDLYVHPNLKDIKLTETKKEKFEIIKPSETELLKTANTPLKAVIYGAENSGKTTLLRHWLSHYYEHGYIPIILNGNKIKDISSDKLERLVQTQFEEQYHGMIETQLSNFEKDRIILLIDDFHRIRFSKTKFKITLISNLVKLFENLIITGSDMMEFELFANEHEKAISLLKDFRKYTIIEFGPRLRYELIKKWNGLGANELDANELIRLNNETEDYVESIIGKSFIPSFPVYILTILQAREASTNQKPEYSMHGFYYEMLINESLNKSVKNKADISLYYNFITEYSYFLFNENIRLDPVSVDSFLQFHENYCEEYNINTSAKLIVDVLTNSKLLVANADTISISYKYVYYFFVAKYMSNNISKDHIRTKIKLLCQRIHRDEFAGIVMFVTHLSKDQFILDEILENSRHIFSDFAPARLEDDISFVNVLVHNLPETVYKPVDIEQLKQDELRQEEELDFIEKEFDTKRDAYDYDIHEDVNTLDIVSKMTRAMRTIDITGQVTKKYWGSLKAHQKMELAEETYMLGLRTLGFYFSLVGQDTEVLVDYLNTIFRKRSLLKDLSKAEIDRISKSFLFEICTMASFGVIKRVSNAIGYEKLTGTFEDLLNKHDSDAVKLIDTSIKLDYHKEFPWDEVKSHTESMSKNYLTGTVLKRLLINYMYVFITSESEKQKICQLANITMNQQRMIDLTSAVRKETSK